ncbi:MAG: MarC family protein [Alphaproteobacteria bacterium]|nr:MarC family protein [Alphaproteobacteria bacterium]
MLEKFNLQEFISAFVVLFAIIDVIGSIPIFMRLRSCGKSIHPEKGAIASFAVFMIFLYLGEALLDLFGIDISSFAIAGSLIIFVIATEMILDIEIFKTAPNTPNDATIVPVAFPLIAGAGALTTLLSIRSQYALINVLLAIFCNIIIVYVVLKLTEKISKFLGAGTIYVLQKIFGIILLAISVKLFITNVSLLIAGH